MCVFVNICHVKALRSPRVGGTGDYEPCNLGAENQMSPLAEHKVLLITEPLISPAPSCCILKYRENKKHFQIIYANYIFTLWNTCDRKAAEDTIWRRGRVSKKGCEGGSLGEGYE